MVRIPTFDLNEQRLALIFLTGLCLTAGWCAWSDTRTEDLRLVPCPAKLVTDRSCPGCGMTRACVSLACGDFGAAWRYHPFAYGLVALAAFVAVSPRRLRTSWQALPSFVRAAFVFFCVIGLLARWVAQLTTL